jgi:hypothetical protein
MTDLELAKRALRADSLAFVIAKDGALLRRGTRDGIGELLEAVDALGDAAHGASLADKIVGKAVAMVARAAQISAVYAPLASESARDMLALDHIVLECDRLVPLVLNQRGDGPCPMEHLLLLVDDPREAVFALRMFIRPVP